MAANGFIGPSLIKLGLVTIVISVMLFMCIVGSIYLLTSYYVDWQRTLFAFDKGIFLIGLITAGSGALIHLLQRSHEK